jgi:L-aspartate oxidase
VRERAGLKRAITCLKDIEHEAGADTVLANMALAGRFIAESALRRHESRGAHARSDFPLTEPAFAHRTFLTLDDITSSGAQEHTAGAHCACSCP